MQGIKKGSIAIYKLKLDICRPVGHTYEEDWFRLNPLNQMSVCISIVKQGIALEVET